MFVQESSEGDRKFDGYNMARPFLRLFIRCHAIASIFLSCFMFSAFAACPPVTALSAPTNIQNTFIRKGAGEYGVPRSSGGKHQGVDLVVNADYKDDKPYAVYAIDGGVVAYSQINGSEDTGYGNVVVVDHGNGCYSLYGHLANKPFSTVSPGGNLDVHVGDSIRAGQRLGYFVSVTADIDSTGNARKTYPLARFQTHFELIEAEAGRKGPGRLIDTILKAPVARADPTGFLSGLGYKYYNSN
jgi:murein DD-endopeptidase MepM/ murein hydrolase activator NlpD